MKFEEEKEKKKKEKKHEFLRRFEKDYREVKSINSVNNSPSLFSSHRPWK